MQPKPWHTARPRPSEPITAGRRGIALPDQLFALIAEHRKRQNQEREHAGTEWHEGGWMFAQPTGKPLDPRRGQ